MYDYNIGIVIPIYGTKFIRGLVKKIFETVSMNNFCICIVHDNKPEIVSFMTQHNWHQNVEIIQLSGNFVFAEKVNAGWKYLTKKFPHIEFLGTISDDTIPYNSWLDVMKTALEAYTDTAIAAPIMEVREGIFRIKKNYSYFKLKNSESPVFCEGKINKDYKLPIIYEGKIDKDNFVQVISGFCFLARRKALESVGYFDERYRNSCEDADLCFKIISNGWRIVVCKDACVFHYGGESRYLKGANTDMDLSRKILAEKWGFNFEYVGKKK
ncbi:MAG: glycosyltransferase [Patescibacteria group bacterium]|nr:glycosyltransferase [Patescibacteria group bacterium]